MAKSLSERSLVWIDTETTGLSPMKNDVIEFAALRDDTEETLVLKINPDRPENAHPKALAVNGYTPEKWAEAGAIPMAEALPKIVAFLGDGILAGQNVMFDVTFLKVTCERYNQEARFGYHLLDTVTLALTHLRPLGIKSVSLGVVCEVLGVTNENAHTALADVQRARAVYQLLSNPTDAQKAEWKAKIEALNAKS